VRRFLLPENSRKGEYGVSRALIGNGFLYARHKAYGIWRWDVSSPGTGEGVEPQGRCLEADGEGRAWTSVGGTAKCLSGDSIVLETGTGEPIRALAHGSDALYALNARGEIHRWRKPYPSPAEQVGTLKQPGFSLKVLVLDGEEHLLSVDGERVIAQPSASGRSAVVFEGTGCRLSAATGLGNTVASGRSAVVLEGDGHRLSAATGLGNTVAALDWGDPKDSVPRPTRVYLWDWHHPATPAMVWRVKDETGHRPQDILLIDP
jgi:hypothetical protein